MPGKVTQRALGRNVNLHSRGKVAKAFARGKLAGKQTAQQRSTGEKQHTGKWYPAEDERKPLRRRFTPGTAKLRSTITPGTVLILLAGRFRGKRVVFLKQLESGLLLVTGPYKINGVPLRRVNQAYVIATSTSVDLSGVSVPEHVNDSYFGKKEEARKTREQEFVAQEVKKHQLPKQKKVDQAAVDTALLANIGKVECLKAYLNARFSLSKADKPHEMKF